MPALENTRHEKFAQELAKGASAGRAYEAAGYDVEGDHADQSASRLLSRNAKVRERVAELQEKAATRTEITIQSLCDELDEAKELAKANAQPAAMVAAVMGKAKLTGHIVDKQVQEQTQTVYRLDAPKPEKNATEWEQRWRQ